MLPWGLPKWGGRLTFDLTTSQRNARRILTREICAIPDSPQFVYTTGGTAPQGEGDDMEQWYVTMAVVYHQGSEARHTTRLRHRTVNLLAVRALESAAILAQLILTDWLAN